MILQTQHGLITVYLVKLNVTYAQLVISVQQQLLYLNSANLVITQKQDRLVVQIVITVIFVDLKNKSLIQLIHYVPEVFIVKQIWQTTVNLFNNHVMLVIINHTEEKHLSQIVYNAPLVISVLKRQKHLEIVHLVHIVLLGQSVIKLINAQVVIFQLLIWVHPQLFVKHALWVSIVHKVQTTQ